MGVKKSEGKKNGGKKKRGWKKKDFFLFFKKHQKNPKNWIVRNFWKHQQYRPLLSKNLVGQKRRISGAEIETPDLCEIFWEK